MPVNTLTFPLMVLASLAGALIAAQGPIYSRMAVDVGNPVHAGMLAFTTGAIFFFLLSVIIGAPLPELSAVKQVPLWVWFGGAIGVFVVLVSIFAVPQLGVASYSVALIAGQLVASYLFDKFGAFGLDPRQFTPANLIGMALVMAGVVLTSYR